MVVYINGASHRRAVNNLDNCTQKQWEWQRPQLTVALWRRKIKSENSLIKYLHIYQKTVVLSFFFSTTNITTGFNKVLGFKS